MYHNSRVHAVPQQLVLVCTGEVRVTILTPPDSQTAQGVVQHLLYMTLLSAAVDITAGQDQESLPNTICVLVVQLSVQLAIIGTTVRVSCTVLQGMVPSSL